MHKIIKAVSVALLLSAIGCSSAAHTATEQVPQSEFMGRLGSTYVYKFRDGAATCYIVQAASYRASVSCIQE